MMTYTATVGFAPTPDPDFAPNPEDATPFWTIVGVLVFLGAIAYAITRKGPRS